MQRHLQATKTQDHSLEQFEGLSDSANKTTLQFSLPPDCIIASLKKLYKAGLTCLGTEIVYVTHFHSTKTMH
jgi:aminoglycoside N3'-acetyltransferase